MKHKLFTISTLCIVGSLLFCGCNDESSQYEISNEQYTTAQKNGDFTSLTDRQKQILEQMELPTDYELLNYTQQHAIKRIEIMLRYLEDKYRMEFSYAGYVPAGVMESEHLTAYPTADGSEGGANLVTVKPDGDTFKDNYASKEIREYYENLCTAFVRDYFQSEQAIVLDYRFSTSLNDLSEVTDVTGITRDKIADYYSNKKLNLNGDYDIIIYGDEIERNQLVPNSRGESVNEP